MPSCKRQKQEAIFGAYGCGAPSGCPDYGLHQSWGNTKTFPLPVIGAVRSKTGKASIRQRDLPAPVVVYYVIALALYRIFRTFGAASNKKLRTNLSQ